MTKEEIKSKLALTEEIQQHLEGNARKQHRNCFRFLH